MALQFEIPELEIERRKEAIRRVWQYEEVDHIPVQFQLQLNPFGYSMREEILDRKKQLDLRLYNIERSLSLIPDDYIPTLFINVGCVGISEAFGCKIHWGDNPQQTPGVRGRILKGGDDIRRLTIPDLVHSSSCSEFLSRLDYFLTSTDFKIPASALDNNGITGVAMDLLGTDQFFLLMYEDPEALDILLDRITDAILSFTEETIRVAQGIEHLTSTDFFYLWCPEGRKGHASSDASAMYSPDFFKRFDVPYNSRVYAQYGPGLLHNCGPNPCASVYLDHEMQISGVNLAYRYSKDDLHTFKEPFKRRGIIYLLFDNETPFEALTEYEKVMNVLAPEVIALPVVFISDPEIDVTSLYREFLKVSKEYARRLWK
ncbi:MAG TPA: uroporphyrinogen decarboxylase family protein [Spirochaetia bacterium]|nr:uroporphyrinogen decarboxylase family protein [Spirochaetia bacterium]